MVDGERPDPVRALLAAWGDIIRQYRRWKGMSRRELASKAGVSPVFLGEIERGEKDASSHTLSLVANALGVPLSELYLRVASRLSDAHSPADQEEEQGSLPLVIHESQDEYLEPVPRSRDETAFELYKVVRRLRSEQQVSLLVLAQSLTRDEG